MKKLGRSKLSDEHYYQQKIIEVNLKIKRSEDRLLELKRTKMNYHKKLDEIIRSKNNG